MKKTLLLFLFICSISIAKAQKTDTVQNQKANTPIRTVYYSVQREPSFPGGNSMFLRFLQANIQYPADSYSKKIEGNVSVSFIVNEDGTLSSIKVIKSVAPDIDAEAIRVISRSPRWVSAIQNGRRVKVQFIVDVNFKLPDQALSNN